MKPCWRDAGLTEKGATKADAALNAMTKAVQKAGDVASAVFREAIFRRDELPARSVKYQKQYLKSNGVKKRRKYKQGESLQEIGLSTDQEFAVCERCGSKVKLFEHNGWFWAHAEG